MQKKLNKATLTKQLKQLVEIRSLSGDGKANAQVLDVVQNLISPKAKVKRIQRGKAEILLLSNTSQLLRPEVGYMVHTDVVAANEDQWQMKVSGSVATGRGVSDMKFSIPVGVAVLNDLIESNSKFSFTFALTTDEEIGGFVGAKFLAEKIKFRPKALVVPDGGDNMVLVEKCKGVAWVKVTAKGESAHASRIFNGKNALAPLVVLATDLLKKYQPNNAKRSWNTTMNIGKIHGGESVNQVCPQAEMVLDFRFEETRTSQEIFEGVKKLATKIGKKLGTDVTTELLSQGDSVFTDVSLPIVKKFIASMEKHLTKGKKVRVDVAFGASDARHFSKFNIPILVIKPRGGDIHTAHEWVDLDSCVDFYESMRDFVGLNKN